MTDRNAEDAASMVKAVDTVLNFERTALLARLAYESRGLPTERVREDEFRRLYNSTGDEELSSAIRLIYGDSSRPYSLDDCRSPLFVGGSPLSASRVPEPAFMGIATQRISLLLAILGLVAAGIGVGFAFADGAIVGSSFAAVAAGASVLYASVAAVLALTNSRGSRARWTQDRRVDRDEQVVVEWASLERQLREVAENALGKPFGEHPVGSIIRKLAAQNLLSEDVLAALQRILEVRNEVAHGGTASSKDLKQVMEAVELVRPKLRELRKASSTPAA